MKSITTYITEKMVYTKVTASKIKYFPESTEELRSIISNKIKNIVIYFQEEPFILVPLNTLLINHFMRDICIILPKN